MAADTHLGCRSRLVLEKLGFDLRPHLEETLRAPLPARLQTLADELGGYAEWRDVGSLSEPTPAAPIAGADNEPWLWALSWEEPLSYRWA